ncbi:hypothetical protein [Paenibacillus sp. Soil522]|uniref:hypothetical protein n=1 Tax=Paenibacillus sp. Soil522 TaxID=1736388 RepID=UPI0006F6E5CE|nr:hypothetical protein [Paenibacillus sp. Soil522]KRE47188.1 hypothetical protein ASG81_10010 [Paenibacillus sp. Soil522]
MGLAHFKTIKLVSLGQIERKVCSISSEMALQPPDGGGLGRIEKEIISIAAFWGRWEKIEEIICSFSPEMALQPPDGGGLGRIEKENLLYCCFLG